MPAGVIMRAACFSRTRLPPARLFAASERHYKPFLHLAAFALPTYPSYGAQ